MRSSSSAAKLPPTSWRSAPVQFPTKCSAGSPAAYLACIDDQRLRKRRPHFPAAVRADRTLVPDALAHDRVDVPPAVRVRLVAEADGARWRRVDAGRFLDHDVHRDGV